jgi:hypothetical protein
MFFLAYATHNSFHCFHPIASSALSSHLFLPFTRPFTSFRGGFAQTCGALSLLAQILEPEEAR